jgi:hypothetical protein
MNARIENRLDILCRYYDLKTVIARSLLAIPPGASRNTACEEYGVSSSILRTMLEYTRYPEASRIERYLQYNQVDVSVLEILDFGCLVADYAIYFARKGASVTLYDFLQHTDFAAYRFEMERLAASIFNVPQDFGSLMSGKDLVVFGEVLEHLDNPLEPLSACLDCQVRFIFTSCYPFGDDYYFSRPGHSRKAQEQQPLCLDFLRCNYEGANTYKREWFWVRRREPGSLFVETKD